jgi:hypothetical protein
VQQDKIGIGNFFWLFASQTYNVKNVQLQKLQAQLAAVAAQNDELSKRVAELKREQASDAITPEQRAAKMARLGELEALDGSQQSQLQDLAELDPDFLAAMKRDTTVATDAANRWTDAVNTLVYKMKSQFGASPEGLAEKYQVTDDLEYV